MARAIRFVAACLAGIGKRDFAAPKTKQTELYDALTFGSASRSIDLCKTFGTLLLKRGGRLGLGSGTTRGNEKS